MKSHCRAWGEVTGTTGMGCFHVGRKRDSLALHAGPTQKKKGSRAMGSRGNKKERKKGHQAWGPCGKQGRNEGQQVARAGGSRSRLGRKGAGQASFGPHTERVENARPAGLGLAWQLAYRC